MKRFIIIISAILAIICFSGCPSPEAASDGENEDTTPNSWLFALYMDADNNLNDMLWADIAYEQLALAGMMQSENTMAPGYPDIKIVVLWDGVSLEGAANFGSTRIHPRSEIYELGPCDQETFDKVDAGDKSWLMSAYSKRLTDEADWLEEEPDMGKVETLAYFLSWVNDRYSAKYKVLLLSDHGAGTDIEMISGGIAQPTGSLCTDDTNSTADGSYLLTASDVKDAISYSGFKPNIIYMDCCLQGNVETAYILRGSADYLVTSANTSYSNNHYLMLSKLTDKSTPKDFAKNIVSTYATYHSVNNMEASEEGPHSSFEETLTQAAYDISSEKQNALYKAMDNLAKTIIKNETSASIMNIFDFYLKQDYGNVDNCKGMAYIGTYFVLNDIGYFCKNLIDDPLQCVRSKTTKDAAKKVVEALDDVIVSSWMGKKTSNSTKFFYTKNVKIYENGTSLKSAYTGADGQFGLTIATESPNGGNAFLTLIKDGFDYYQPFFGYSENWGKLYKYWLAD